jgi:hypothetical protein
MMKLRNLAVAILTIFMAAGLWAQSSATLPFYGSRGFGKYYAPNYAYGLHPASAGGKIATGNTVTGSATITLVSGTVTLPDGRVIVPYAVGVPIAIADSLNETVTPTAVSGCVANAPNNTCLVTASFTNLHGAGALVTSGTAGAAEAAFDAFNNAGGGTVVIDSYWAALGGVNTMFTATTNQVLPYQPVSFEDDRVGSPPYWNIEPTTTSFLATPTTLTATTVGFGLNGATTTGGSYTGTSTYHVCVAYVDIMGNEGACSADFSGLTAGTGATNQIGFAAPAASTGAVGYTVYISLAAGSYALAYQVPILASVCTLTKLETITPACAVANSTYGQSASNAIVSTLTVNTSPLALQLGGTNNQLGTGNSGSHTTYAYAPSAHLGNTTVLGANVPFTATAGGAASTNPVVMATIPIPAGFMNFPGKTIQVCAKLKQTLANSPTIENWQIYWDGAGSDAAGSPVQIGNIQGTATFTNVAYNGSFCEQFTTTVSGAGVTAGSIIGGANVESMGIASAPTNLVTMLDTLNAATGSLNLAGGAGFTTRLHIVTNHTTGADGASQVLTATVTVI